MHIEEVETGLREGRKTQRAYLGWYNLHLEMNAEVFLLVEKTIWRLAVEWLRFGKTVIISKRKLGE